MTMSNRRGFLRGSAMLAGAAAAGGAAGLANAGTSAPAGGWEVKSQAGEGWTPVRVINTPAMPWGEPNERGWRFKFLYNNETTGDHLVLIDVPIGAPGGKNHYHDFHEWAYWLSGDFTNNEFTSPMQREGVMQQFREGVFLDRPAYSLHGGEEGRLDSQVGGTCLIMEEGGTTFGVIPEEEGYSDDWKKVKQWSVPRIIDTLADMPWEDAGEGIMVKRLVSDQVRGFKARLWRLAAGFEYTDQKFGAPWYYDQAWQFNYMLNGEMKLQAYEAPGKPAGVMTVGKDWFIERAPRSILGLPKGEVTRFGAVWLQVTYAKGTSIPMQPIEKKKYA